MVVQVSLKLCLLHLFVWDSDEEKQEEEEEEDESEHSRYPGSSENQSGCSVATLFRINTRLFI